MARALAPRADERFLEPCIGNGSLVRALARRGISSKKIRGLDLEPIPRPSDRYASVVRGIDFLEWSTQTTERFDKIIANPPFLALNRLPSPLKENALRVVEPFSRGRIVLGGNYWHAFLCAGLSLLERDGDLCFLLPAAWDYSNYARTLRDELPKHFEHVYVHRSRSPLFEKVREGSVVLVARGFRRPNRSTARIEHATVKDVLESLVKPVSPTLSTPATIPTFQSTTTFTKLGELVEIRIGAVTGDSAYFLLAEQRRRALGIPARSCVPVLTRSSHTQSSIITRGTWKSLRDTGERVWLFRPTRSQLGHQAVQRYLRLKPENGGCLRQRFKIQCRSPWYETILPSNVNGFLSGMSSAGPWIALSRMQELSATNTLYVVTFKKAKTSADRAAIGLSLLTTSAREALSNVGRRYADGLLKYEPGDLKDVEVPLVTKLRGVINRYRSVIAKLLAGEILEAQRLADDWIQ
jgi:adenine-specific DNA-methyltransferase